MQDEGQATPGRALRIVAVIAGQGAPIGRPGQCHDVIIEVAGAFALLSEEYPKSSMEQRLWFIRQAGVPIATEHGPVPRLQMRAHEEVLPAGVLFPGVAEIAGTDPDTIMKELRTALGENKAGF